MDMEDLYIQTEMFILVNGLMIKQMEKEPIFHNVVPNM